MEHKFMSDILFIVASGFGRGRGWGKGKLPHAVCITHTYLALLLYFYDATKAAIHKIFPNTELYTPKVNLHSTAALGFNPIALRKTKIVYSFCLSECNKVTTGLWKCLVHPVLLFHIIQIKYLSVTITNDLKWKTRQQYLHIG